MAQKLILCEAAVDGDVLVSAPIAAAIAAGYVVTSANGYVTRDNRHMALVLLTEPAAETTTTTEETPASNDTPAASENDGEGGEGGENTGGDGEGGDGEGSGSAE